jgi:hypothetical protein
VVWFLHKGCVNLGNMESIIDRLPEEDKKFCEIFDRLVELKNNYDVLPELQNVIFAEVETEAK